MVQFTFLIYLVNNHNKYTKKLIPFFLVFMIHVHN